MIVNNIDVKIIAVVVHKPRFPWYAKQILTKKRINGEINQLKSGVL